MVLPAVSIGRIDRTINLKIEEVNMFRKSQKSQESLHEKNADNFPFASIENYIAEMEKVIGYYKKAINDDEAFFIAPECEIEIFDEDDQCIHVGTRESIKNAIAKHKERVTVLKKIQQEAVITPEEHKLLLLMPIFEHDPKIKDYEHVENSKACRHV